MRRSTRPTSRDEPTPEPPTQTADRPIGADSRSTSRRPTAAAPSRRPPDGEAEAEPRRRSRTEPAARPPADGRGTARPSRRAGRPTTTTSRRRNWSGTSSRSRARREDTIRDALERRVKIQGLQRFFGRIVVPDREDHRDPQQQEADRRAEDVSRLHHGPDGAEREDLVRGPRDPRRRRLRRGPRHADQDDRGRSQPDARTRRRRRPTAEAPKVRIDVERGDRVKIKDGPFENFEGTVEEVIEGRGLVKVMLIIFNRPTPVDLEYWQVERI